MRHLALSLALGLLCSAVAVSAATIWIEGESYLRTNRVPNPWAQGDQPSLLSGGAAAGFIESSAHAPLPSYVLWRTEVPETATYLLYLRSMSLSSNGRSRLRFVRIDPVSGQPFRRPDPAEGWLELDTSATPLDSVPAGEWRNLEWTFQGRVQLEAGSYLVDLQSTGLLEPRNDVWLGLDVICLTTDATFRPRGTAKPAR